MKGTPAIYLGRIISKVGFRTFIYAPDGSSHLVESWEEFENKMQTGLWFATKEEIKPVVNAEEETPKKRQRKTKNKEGVLNEVAKMLDDESNEVTDDFLPKG